MTRRRKAIAFFVALCVVLVAAAVSLNVGWILINLNTRRAAPLVLGIISFALIIAGLIVYTVFLVLELLRNEELKHFALISAFEVRHIGRNKRELAGEKFHRLG